MKRKFVTVILFSAILAMITGCGGTKNEPAATETTTETEVNEEPATDTPATEVQGEKPAVEFEVTNYDSYAEDGTLLYVASITVPKITIPGNTEAQDKINAFMDQMVAGFQEEKTSYDEIVNDNYSDWLEFAEKAEGDTYNDGYTKDNKWDEDYQGNFVNRNVTVSVLEGDLISFKVEGTEFTGGANGNAFVQGITFLAETGELVGLPQFFEKDLNGATEYIAGKVLEFLEADDFKEYLLDDYKDYVDTFATQDKGSYWYVTDKDFIAIIPETTAAAHVVGPLEIPVPLADLESYR